MDRRANRTALAREARRIAEEVEGLYIQLEQVGALARVRHYMITHQEGVPQFDMLQAAKALRCYVRDQTFFDGSRTYTKRSAIPSPNSFHRPQLGVDSSSSGKRTLEIISISRRLVFGFSRCSRIATRLSMLPIG
jgi:hypothetical protein